MLHSRFVGDEFNEFLKQIIAEKCLEPKEEGITKLVLDKGFKVLSVKQKHVFAQAMLEITNDDCQRCGLEVPWCEMYSAYHNGGLCSWCEHQQDVA